jgi:hypothetical protein
MWILLAGTFDAAGAWKQKLGIELEAAGFEIEWKKAMI